MAKRYGMVLDLEKCIGCYSCNVACKAYYGTRPEINYNQVEKIEWGEYPDAKQNFKLTMCMHCDDAPCVAACPVEATYISDEGVVLMDYDKCIGCGACISACPYGQRQLVKDDVMNFEGLVTPYEEEASERMDIVEKCTLCYGRLKNGEEPACVVHCPGKSRIFGDVNDPNSDISKHIKENNAVHVKNTGIYYVIPEGMDRSLLPADLLVAVKEEQPVKEAETVTTDDNDGEGINVGAVAAGVGVAAAVGGGYAYKKSQDKKKDEETSKGGEE